MELVCLSFIILFGGSYSAGTILLGRNARLHKDYDTRSRQSLTEIHSGKVASVSPWRL
jgi:hypothetical protein